MMVKGSHRLHALCSYFAMFPGYFARGHIRNHSAPGELILDPFSGRGTTLLESLLTQRNAVASDPNPVAYCITRAKSKSLQPQSVLNRITKLEAEFVETPTADLEEERGFLPRFFKHAYYHTTLREILFLRRHLRWHTDTIDCFISALLLGCLHGERDKSPCYLSNQMPRRISTKPEYSVKYWREHDLYPHKRATFEILRRWSRFRLKQGAPQKTALALQEDVRDLSRRLPFMEGKVKAVITSPPYFNTTSFAEDQWLRLWVLGGANHPTRAGASKDDRHTSRYKYWRFIADAWRGIAPLLASDATIVCRVGLHGHSMEDVCRNMVASVRASIPSATLYGSPLLTTPSADTGRQQLSEHSQYGELDFIFRMA